MRRRSFVRATLDGLAVACVAAGVLLSGCSDDDPEAADPAASTATTTTTTSGAGFCTDLERFYEANGAFFLTVTSGEATTADLDQLVTTVEDLPAAAPPEVAADVETVVGSVLGLVEALRQVDLTDPAAVTPLLIESTDDDAVAAADRMDAHARDGCGFDPEDAVTPG